MTANEKLKAWMVIEGLTDRAVAERLGLDPSYVWYLRHGQREITDSLRWKFAVEYGYDVAVKVLGGVAEKA